ncbi:MAG TPA: hypothetical protein VFR55_08900 [Dehalococcoidia bacterium]|nr:hypothetical protein [Dehalococcoidia bacterium]
MKNSLISIRGMDGSGQPLAIVGAGTAQTNRQWDLVRHLQEASCLDRCQFIMSYDINQSTVNRIGRDTRRRKVTSKVVLPSFVPVDDGFLRNPHGYQKYAGLFDQDQDKMVEQARKRSDEVGSDPQVIIVFLGFGGHSLLGLRLFGKITKAFPDSTVFPAVLIPQEPILEEAMRREIWSACDEALAGHQALITENGIGDPRQKDHQLAVALAAMEAAGKSYPQNGMLSDFMASRGRQGGGWFGVSVASRLMPTVKNWRLFPPGREERVPKDQVLKLSWLVRNTIWVNLEDQAQLAQHESPDHRVMQDMTVTLPLEEEAVMEEVKESSLAQVKAEGIFQQYHQLTIAFARARFSMPGKKDPHIHVSQIYPIQGELEGVARIMRQQEEFPYIVESGFGSGYYLNGHHHQTSSELIPAGI